MFNGPRIQPAITFFFFYMGKPVFVKSSLIECNNFIEVDGTGQREAAGPSFKTPNLKVEQLFSKTRSNICKIAIIDKVNGNVYFNRNVVK